MLHLAGPMLLFSNISQASKQPFVGQPLSHFASPFLIRNKKNYNFISRTPLEAEVMAALHGGRTEEDGEPQKIRAGQPYSVFRPGAEWIGT